MWEANPTWGSPRIVGELAKLDIDGNKAAKDSYVYAKNGKLAGTVTSAMWSPAVKANIAMAMVRGEYERRGIWVEIYYAKELRQYRKVVRATVQDKPFWTPARVSQTPPPER